MHRLTAIYALLSFGLASSSQAYWTNPSESRSLKFSTDGEHRLWIKYGRKLPHSSEFVYTDRFIGGLPNEDSIPMNRTLDPGFAIATAVVVTHPHVVALGLTRVFGVPAVAGAPEAIMGFYTSYAPTVFAGLMGFAWGYTHTRACLGQASVNRIIHAMHSSIERNELFSDEPRVFIDAWRTESCSLITGELEPDARLPALGAFLWRMLRL